MNIPEKRFLIPTMKLPFWMLILPALLISCAPTPTTSSNTPQSEPVQQPSRIETASFLTVVNNTKKSINLSCDQGTGETALPSTKGVCSYYLSSEKSITTVSIDGISIASIRIVNGKIEVAQNSSTYRITQQSGSSWFEVTSK